jgi:hypothetical protein
MFKMVGASRLGDDRRIVCRRCGLVMNDVEPRYIYGEFMHAARRVCSNSGKFFSLAPEHAKEVMPFESKRARRAAKRAGARI